MKKLTLKKTTLSRLNESTLAKVKGGTDPAQETGYTAGCYTYRCLDTGRCVTGIECELTQNDDCHR
jgi:hypothetical protein